MQDALATAGYLIVPGLIPIEQLAELRDEADRFLADAPGRGGVRNLLKKSPRLRGLATQGSPAELATAVLGPEARPTKLTLFDKTPEANWKVPWHQDLTITVAERRDAPGFGPWSIKDGLPHVQPPVSVLERILAIRVHLDETPAENGALRVLPGTHRLGRLSESRIAELRQQVPEALCAVPAGGAMLMSPLLVHASSASRSPSRRRVLHFEYSSARLPEGLVWA
jgi:ectoine hydroxylase-related dioxygenase (phytanoyl-CoA dioxygenase family)